MYKNIIDPKYISTKKSLENSFSEAFLFYKNIEEISDDSNYHIGTNINLHFYYKDKFLFYLKKNNKKSIIVSSQQNGIIKSGTTSFSIEFLNYVESKLKINKFSESVEIVEFGKNSNKKFVVYNEIGSEIFFKQFLDLISNFVKKSNNK